jgi:single-strand DNA-binding protein
MAFSVNWVHLVGRLGQAPEMRYTPEGHAITRFSLATDRAARAGAEPATDWHQVICWRKLAEFAGEYLAKGRLVTVTGHLTYRTWEGRDGQRRRTAEVVATEIVLLDRRPDGGAREAEPVEGPADGPNPDDDIPF